MQDNTIKLFMWGYQQHVQISFEVTAEGLFNKIDRKLNPNVFFVGVLVDEREDRHPICLEPEDSGFQVESFKDLKGLANQLEMADKETRMFHSHPIAQESHTKRIANKSYREAIRKILKRDHLYDKNEFFVAHPTYVEGYQVFTILSLNKEVLGSYYTLSKNEWGRLTIYNSFIDSAIHVFLSECTQALKDPNNSLGAIERDAHELFRVAGKKFMYTISSAGGNFEGLHHLYDACNEIASLKYEGAIGIGNMIVAPKEHKNVKLTLQLKEPIKIRDYRKVRKFLELSDNDVSIVSDSALIYGIGELRGKYNPREENLFVVSFTGHFKWELFHDNNPLMVVEYKEPALPSDKINREKFYSDFSRIFKGIIGREQIADLWEIVIEATKQKHGTMLVISSAASEEANRLSQQSFPVVPLKLTDKIIPRITSIDGAVLLDPDATCYAIGVIMDGLATEKGDSSRGARYNSAIRYLEQHKKDASIAIVIVSEDGMVNIIPDLRPQVKHADITEAIENFKELEKSSTLNYKDFNRSMGFFRSLKFYLTQQECDTINTVRKEIEEKFKEDLSAVRIVHYDLSPDPEMNSSYYEEE